MIPVDEIVYLIRKEDGSFSAWMKGDIQVCLQAIANTSE